MAIQYHIFQERIIPIINHFFSSEEEYGYSLKESKNKYEVFVYRKADAKKERNRGIINIFFPSAKTSFSVQGKPEFNDVCERCIHQIIAEAEISNVNSDNKCFTYRNVDTETFNIILGCLNEIPYFSLTLLPSDINIVSRHNITGPFNTHATLTYYHTSTLCLQGIISSLLIRLVTEINSLLDVEKLTDENSFMTVLEATPAEVISSDLSVHFSNLPKLATTPYPELIKSSIQLVNSNVELGDYSCILFGILRAMEGIIGLRMNQERKCLVSKDDKLGNFFCPRNDGSSKFRYNNKFTEFDFKIRLKAACEEAYSFYNKYRHPYFHVDILVPMSTYVIINKSDAADLLEDALKHIANILKNWDE